jgi:hypothetical protein
MAKLCKCGCGRPVSETISKHGRLQKNQYYSVECRKSRPKKAIPEKRVCACGCGKEFMSKRKDSIYYSDRCRTRAYEDKIKVIGCNEIPPKCLCGCGQDVTKDTRGKWNKYIANHYKTPIEVMKLLLETGKLGRPQGYRLSESTKELMSIKHQEHWSDPEYKQRHLEAIQAGREKRKIRITTELGDPPLCLCGCGVSVSRRGNCWNKYIKGHYEAMENRLKMESLGDPPLCRCGCGNRVTLNNRGSRWNEYYSKHYQKDLDYRTNMSNVMNTPEKKVELSEKGKDLYKNPEYVERLHKSMNRKPNGFESLFERLKPDMFIKYVGDFKLWITLPNGKSKNPDFIIEGTNKVIELHGDYWHKGEDASELIKAYKDSGYDCLVIWENEMSDIQSVMKRVSDFLKIV